MEISSRIQPEAKLKHLSELQLERSNLCLNCKWKILNAVSAAHTESTQPENTPNHPYGNLQMFVSAVAV